MTIVKILLGLFGFCGILVVLAWWERERCPVCQDKIEMCDVPVWGVGADGILREDADKCGEAQPCPWHGGAR